MTSPWRHHPIDFLWNSTTDLKRAYLCAIPNFNLIRHKRAEIFSTELTENYEKKMDFESLHCDLDLSPQGHQFQKGLSQCNQLFSKKRVQIGVFVYKFCSQAESDTHTQDQLQWKYNHSTISWRFKKDYNKNHSENANTSIFSNPNSWHVYTLLISIFINAILMWG